jgi:hypothetical protein
MLVKGKIESSRKTSHVITTLKQFLEGHLFEKSKVPEPGKFIAGLLRSQLSND